MKSRHLPFYNNTGCRQFLKIFTNVSFRTATSNKTKTNWVLFCYEIKQYARINKHCSTEGNYLVKQCTLVGELETSVQTGQLDSTVAFSDPEILLQDRVSSDSSLSLTVVLQFN